MYLNKKKIQKQMNEQTNDVQFLTSLHYFEARELATKKII